MGLWFLASKAISEGCKLAANILNAYGFVCNFFSRGGSTPLLTYACTTRKIGANTEKLMNYWLHFSRCRRQPLSDSDCDCHHQA